MNDPEEAIVSRNHPIYWFEDGSLVLDVEVQRFKVHHTLVSRHSRFFSGLAEKKISSGSKNGTISAETPTLNDNRLKHVVLEPKRQVRATDVEALLQHLYHDVPLGKDSSFAHVTSILRVSSPQQLDYPYLHRAAGEIFEGMFPTDPGAFTHNHPLYDALPVATHFNFKAARKAILYSLVTTTEFDVSDGTTTSTMDPQVDQTESESVLSSGRDTDSIAVTVGSRTARSQSAPTETPRPVSSAADSEICMALMTRLIEHFTPILFTPPATSHMGCTDVFAETWMPLVIQPAIDDDGVYKPLETLQRIKGIDWAKQGLCGSCVLEKRDEWTGEQTTVWNLMDSWLDELPPRLNPLDNV